MPANICAFFCLYFVFLIFAGVLLIVLLAEYPARCRGGSCVFICISLYLYLYFFVFVFVFSILNSFDCFVGGLPGEVGVG